MSYSVVYFSHGQESGPWGTKIQYLAEIARRRGFDVESPDYSDLSDPEDRIKRLLDLTPKNVDKLILVGSSAGGYVSAIASETLHPTGLFLLAPAVLLRGFGKLNPQPRADHRWIVHGWNDEIVLPGSVISFAEQHKMQLHMLDGDHRLLDVLPSVGDLFELFLHKILVPSENILV
uniref:Alpha/beta superfamily hydrolase n=1 Tax=Candidatus Kentrum sp. TC TaxID=2126339 RepID=A0A450Z710_9GAMM|nr:MAG: Alpha/beta superfamily hydrolase [Candidatus Kentron sp. TC]VFK49575.1 MAG: Alpha/beta superfamily hydrolase [Candidatus Kentron sp. TC]VFK62219.1 MAG: Alpha/beta superfamily hydrolase [Candidatus Kentron sp. TC]